ncbi:hypothetical protein [Streptomyces sp. SAS_272]|uniref:hypothetical protein n=1 Tax=Streptomyces sp. SAS_272 TaxID=3412747 RepID=UPI00403CA32C
MSTARRHPRSRTWLRVLVVLIALLAPAAPAGFAVPSATAASETVEYDVLDAPLRPASCPHRSAAPLRPSPITPGDPATRPLSSPARASHPPHPLSALRTVILRC